VEPAEGRSPACPVPLAAAAETPYLETVGKLRRAAAVERKPEAGVAAFVEAKPGQPVADTSLPSLQAWQMRPFSSFFCSSFFASRDRNDRTHSRTRWCSDPLGRSSTACRCLPRGHLSLGTDAMHQVEAGVRPPNSAGAVPPPHRHRHPHRLPHLASQQAGQTHLVYLS